MLGYNPARIEVLAAEVGAAWKRYVADRPPPDADG